MSTVSPTGVTEATLWQLLEEVKDPEVPVLSIIDLGIVRKVAIENDQIYHHYYTYLFGLSGYGCYQYGHSAKAD